MESRRRGVFVVGLTLDDIEELYLLRRLRFPRDVRGAPWASRVALPAVHGATRTAIRDAAAAHR